MKSNSEKLLHFPLEKLRIIVIYMMYYFFYSVVHYLLKGIAKELFRYELTEPGLV